MVLFVKTTYKASTLNSEATVVPFSGPANVIVRSGVVAMVVGSDAYIFAVNVTAEFGSALMSK